MCGILAGTSYPRVPYNQAVARRPKEEPYKAPCQGDSLLGVDPMETLIHDDYTKKQLGNKSTNKLDRATYSFFRRKSMNDLNFSSPGSGMKAHATSSLCGFSLIWRRNCAAFSVCTRPSIRSVLLVNRLLQSGESLPRVRPPIWRATTRASSATGVSRGNAI